jgi:hypothetical protein
MFGLGDCAYKKLKARRKAPNENVFFKLKSFKKNKDDALL